jgi:hypothetical protein
VDANLRVNGYFPNDSTLLTVVAQSLHKADSDAVRQECGNQHVDFLPGEVRLLRCGADTAPVPNLILCHAGLSARCVCSLHVVGASMHQCNQHCRDEKTPEDTAAVVWRCLPHITHVLSDAGETLHAQERASPSIGPLEDGGDEAPELRRRSEQAVREVGQAAARRRQYLARK